LAQRSRRHCRVSPLGCHRLELSSAAGLPCQMASLRGILSEAAAGILPTFLTIPIPLVKYAACSHTLVTSSRWYRNYRTSFHSL
jgi:hypothetical protein